MECQVKVNANELSGKELKDFNKAAERFLKSVAKVGQKIQSKGNESQKAAWAGIKEITVDSNSGGAGRFGGMRAGEHNAESDSITFFNEAVTAPGSAKEAVGYTQTLISTHEIFHGEAWNKQAKQTAMAIEDRDERDHAVLKLERVTEMEAQNAVRIWGLLPANVTITNSYLQQ